ncbi:peptide/nickel transport system ATP-binding protein/oligopeptide transport system ATP-binding protein [Faunimonas pinastri]|uniref:Peptide/nickel transport system ATP-binding protein/oligopeptide transport system ATP-binding protein n=1 Tax=Faunimonas pinastri TaxID=1855383 RepID=A0A1H9ICL3_9HYPH|nr:ABC transporter ATP-binding protein [Faunimonas pinastri]SEQ72294.1 peptide/nickel transport system ATP-binding protein/oligopeptide transport system ATP-binding protein [Faunimonas pinastri]
MSAIPAERARAGQGATLSVRDLTTSFDTSGSPVTAVDRVSFDVEPGQVLGLVGESGSGKSVTLRSLLRLARAPAETTGSVLWDGRDILALPEAKLRAIRGNEIAMIFQEPMTALNPVLTVQRQIDESLRAHTRLSARDRRVRAIELLDLVGIPAAAGRLDDYPHQFSGGMRQRVMIAIALAGEPRLLLADEPTTALDVTIQDQILKLILDLRERLGMSVILVTHDLGVVAQTCDRVAVMYAGRIVETGEVGEIFREPHHPYTRGLLGSVPRGGTERRPLLSIEGTPPSLAAMPSGCAFHPRCSFRTDICFAVSPPLEPFAPGRQVACHHHQRVAEAGLP